MPDTILLMDNDITALEKWGGLLEEDGYCVLRASSTKDAEELLRHRWIHLAILDIRMEDERDENDISGLLVARNPEFASIPKIILTAYPSFEYVRGVLAPDEKGLVSGVDFIAKYEGPRALRQAIRQAFANNVRINWDLEIQWDQRNPLSFLHLVNLLQPGLPADTLVHLASELEDLIRRLFYDYSQAWIGELLWHSKGHLCLSAVARSSNGVTVPCLLICGDREALAKEWEYATEFTPKTQRETRPESRAETLHFGVNAYGLPDADIETLQTVRVLFQGGKERPLKAAFSNLLDEVLPAWHQHGHKVETLDLMALYRLWTGLLNDITSQKEAEQQVESLIQAVRPFGTMEIKRHDQLITFSFPNQPLLTYPDPVATAYALLVQHDAPVTCRVSPGRLTADNVLIDSEQQAWLTDFAFAGLAPQWWDFVCLEAAIRFELSQAPDVLAWQEFEECLVTPTQLHERLRNGDVIPNLRTSVNVIEQIRWQASTETGPNPLPYYAGLLVWAVGAMASYDPQAFHTRADLSRGVHLLLGASMVAGWLDSETVNTPLAGELRMNEDGMVWIGDRYLMILMGHKKALLQLLFENRGTILSRRTIMKTVFDETYQPRNAQQESRINSLIKLLREDIEPYPRSPRYILTVRGGGYRLQVSGKPDS